VVDEAGKQIVATGVRIFPEGVDRDQQGGEMSKNEQRRIARGMRRQVARRARRQRLLREALVKAGLLPEVALRAAGDPQREAWERDTSSRRILIHCASARPRNGWSLLRSAAYSFISTSAAGSSRTVRPIVPRKGGFQDAEGDQYAGG
jgi:hypothetical protein